VLLSAVLQDFGPSDRIWASVIAQRCNIPVSRVAVLLLDWSNAGRLVRYYEVKCPRCGLPAETRVVTSLGDITHRRFNCLTCEVPFAPGPDDVFVFYQIPS